MQVGGIMQVGGMRLQVKRSRSAGASEPRSSSKNLCDSTCGSGDRRRVCACVRSACVQVAGAAKQPSDHEHRLRGGGPRGWMEDTPRGDPTGVGQAPGFEVRRGSPPRPTPPRPAPPRPAPLAPARL
jgi:hypothetical protein